MRPRATVLVIAASLACLSGCLTPAASGHIDANRAYKIQARGHVGMSQTMFIGEAAQYLDIRARSHKAPVLLHIHGGPGRSALPVAHVYGGSLERRFVVVHWDQRGTHRSYTEDEAGFPLTLDQLVRDTVELAGLLAEWFDKERILLLAEGTGAIPAVLAAKAHPERFFGLVLLSPVVDVQAGLAHGYQWALDRTYAEGPREALQALQALGAPPWSEDSDVKSMVVLSKWLDELGGTVPGLDAQVRWRKLAGQAKEARRLRATEAKLGEAHSLERLWPELRDIDLKTVAPSLDVPVFFLAGEADQRAPFAETQAYYEALVARQGKTLVRLGGVGHWPLLEASDRVIEVLGGRVWPLAQ